MKPTEQPRRDHSSAAAIENASRSSDSAGPPAVAGEAPIVASTLATNRSYAQASRTSVPGVSSPIAPGHASSASVSSKHQPANMAAPAIVNSNPPAANGASASDHARKPSRTISASGATGEMPNGAPTPTSARPNISFGSINANGAAPIASSTPTQAPPPPQPATHSQQTLPAPQNNPPTISPQSSPAPIPEPSSSGGRQGPVRGSGNYLSFGSMGNNDADGNAHRQSQMHGSQQQPLMPGQNAHFRRPSSHSQHGEMPNQGLPTGPSGNRGGYMGGPPRGRGGYPHVNAYPQHQQMPSYSPAQAYQRMSGPQRPNSHIPPHMHGQVNMGPHPGSPQPPPRSPAMGSQPGTPNMQQMQMQPQGMGYAPQYQAAYLDQVQQGHTQMPYQQQYAAPYGYYQQPFPSHPNYMQPPPPQQGPRQFRQAPPTVHQQYTQNQMPRPPSANMSRTSSQVSDRPASSLGTTQPVPQAPPHPTPPTAPTQTSHSHSQSTSAAPSASTFTIPNRAKKGIVIKNADGEVVTFGDKKGSPAPAIAQSPSPVNASSTSTPPPRSSSVSSHAPSHSRANRSVAEIKAEFQENVKREQEKEKEQQIKEETEPKAAKDETTAEPQPAPEEQTKEGPKEAEAIEATATEKAAPVSEPEKAEPVTAGDSAAEKRETDEEREKRLQEEEDERMIAEMEAKEREEEERERAFQEKRKKEAEEKAAKEKEEALNADERMKQAEREAEALEESRAQEKPQEEDSEDARAEREKMFATLKKPAVGPAAGAESPSGTETPKTTTSEESAPLPRPLSGKPIGASKPKPAALKLETAKSVEAAQPTPGMRSLQSARMLELKNEAIDYPDGVQSPNPALNQSGKRGGRLYDKIFLMQFQDVFREKPAVDWDQKLKDTLGDDPNTAGPKSARTPSGAGPRGGQAHRNAPQTAFPPQVPMGTFGATGRTLPPGTTSADRFNAASTSNARPSMQNPFAQHIGRPSGGAFNMPPQMGRPPQGMGQQAAFAQQSNRNSRGGSKTGRVDSRQPTRKEQEKDNSKMPLTAGANLKPLQASGGGWKSASAGRAVTPAVDPSGNLPPDMVQRKVKANLNKMTPERFDKISGQILEISSQSRNEVDGRSLRQVIALLFEKACDEAHWASMYAMLAHRMLQDMTSEIRDENVTDKQGNPVVGGALFRKYLLNRCQEEFERGWEVNLPMNAEGQTEEAAMLSDEYYKAAAAKRKGLGLVQFIGELFKLGMLSMRIMCQCVQRLLDFQGAPEEASIEGLVKLLRTVGGAMESSEGGPQIMGAYFERIEKIMSQKLPSRMHFMLLDVVDLRRHGWRSKDDAKGPKTIQQIREEAAIAQQQAELERQRQHQRGPGGRGMPGGRDNRNFSGGGMPPPDYAKNTVGTDDLRRLNAKNQSSRQASSGPSKMGPPSMFPSRSGSGRTLGPQVGSILNRGDDSSPSSSLHSRSASVKAGEKKEDDQKSSLNAFR